MLSKGQSYFLFFVYAIKLSNLSFSIPYKYDGNSDSVKIIGRKSKGIYNATLLSHVLYLTIICVYLYLFRDKMPVLKVLQGSVIIIAYVSSAVCRITLFIWEKDGLLLLNGFLGFEKNLVKSKNLDNFFKF